MGALTFTQMQTLVKRTVNNRNDLDTEIEQALNNSYLQTALLRGFTFRELDAGPQTFATIDGTSLYTFSTILTAGTARNIMAIFSPIRDTTNSANVKATSIQDIDSKSTTNGKPRWFAHFGSGIVLNPTPDAAYTISFRYRLRPARLSSGSDVSVLPEEFDWAIVWGAAADINAAIGVLDKSSFYSTKRREALDLVSTSLEAEDEYADFALAPDLGG